MKQGVPVLVFLLLRNVLAWNECSVCACCKGGESSCQYYHNYPNYCVDGCIDGYFGVKCQQACIRHINHCLKCSNQYHCTRCSDGYYGQYCYKCPQNCLTCTDFNTCNSCRDGFYSGKYFDQASYDHNNDCRYSCQTNCKSCTSYHTCTECVDGKHKANNNDCSESCNSACNSCTSYNNCTSCPSGKYGNSCQNNCGPGCKDHQCDITTARCTCVPNFDGDRCDQCVIGWHGTNCNMLCSGGCSGNICTRNGNCIDCRTGFTGSRCDQCLKGKYGSNCDRSCPKGCYNDTCQDNGDCNSCKHGFTGIKCDRCVSGAYGNNCDNKCLENCKTCYSGTSCSLCNDRYWLQTNTCQPCPSNCLSCSSDTECLLCDSGFFGLLCNAKCHANCRDGTCDERSGLCRSCVDGFYGDKCDKSCPENCAINVCDKSGKCYDCKSGYHGDNCSTKCRDNCNECFQSDGSCKRCTDGYFGTSCEKICPMFCKPGVHCRRSNGYCSECADGYYYSTNCNNRCSANCRTCNHLYCTSCKDGKFGKYEWNQFFECNSDCPVKCLNKSCDDTTGYCNYGCVRGYWGNQCRTECPVNCKYNECFNNGTCLSGCKEGYKGYNCKCPINCDCDANGKCNRCVSGYENTKRNCKCSRAFCFDDKCSSCSGSSFYLDNASCCQCSSTCKKGQCESALNCLNGCSDGYRGDSCQDLCEDIDPRCSKCTTNFTHTTGHCLECIHGYYPDAIARKCVVCSDYCENSTCSAQNGTCTRGCMNGKWGERCDKSCGHLCNQCTQLIGKCTVCKNGKYSLNCSTECSRNCSASNGLHFCAITDGSCLNGCDTFSKYGKHCELTCGSNCINQTCTWKTGNCLHGCVDNFYGDQCDKTCNINCLTTNKEKRCDDKTGHCFSGCLDGFYGVLCDQRCSANCVNTTCSRQSGECVHGCKPGYMGTSCVLAMTQTGTDKDGMGVTIGAAAGGGLFLLIIIVVIIVVLLLKRRRRRDKCEKNDMVEINANTDNTTVTYSEIVANDPAVEQNDADVVYALPNKPKKNVDRVKSSNENATKTISNPNYEKPSSQKDVLVDRTDDCKPQIAVKPVPVYDNNRRSVATHKSTIHSDDAALEVEEDIDSITTSSKTKSFALADESNKPESDNPDTYYNVLAVKKRKIALDLLPDFVAKKTKKHFAEEFQQLPPGLIKPYVDSQRRANLSKNRYKGIYPYDATRVVLKEGDSDYINASYIDGYNKRQAYIASIGPTYKYMGDMSAFWIMVWQEKVGKIVMLTNLEEGGAPKCDQYWPETDFSLMYANIQVTCQSEETYADYTVRSFSIQKDSEKRNIVQVHFTAWPDKGTPDDVTSLIEFRQKVISTKTELEGPIIVHCSAGIGRTGTYIALDSLTKEGEAEGEVDIYACVRNMREQRVNMVQTAEQYQYLHNAVVHTLTFDSKAVEASTFATYMTTHTDDHLTEKFERLQASVEQRSDDEKEAVKRNEALGSKNRNGADIPGDRNRPKLYLDRKPGSSGYINAVYVNSHTTINRYLVAQTPLPDTVVDFLTLIVQEKVSCIVNMETDASDDKTIGTYHPADNQTLKKGTFSVKSEREKSTDQYVLCTLKILHKGNSGTEEVTIPHIHFTHWNKNKNIPEEPSNFVQFIKDVEVKYGGNKSKGPILVHCLTGAEKSGLFCVVSNLLEKTQIDQETSVVNTVRQVKYRRHMSVPNKDQYIFCHQCVNEYLRTFDIYSNFELKT